MIKILNKYFIIFTLALALIEGYASAQLVAQAHKPPILTTTAIIEIHEGGKTDQRLHSNEH